MQTWDLSQVTRAGPHDPWWNSFPSAQGRPFLLVAVRESTPPPLPLRLSSSPFFYTDTFPEGLIGAPNVETQTSIQEGSPCPHLPGGFEQLSITTSALMGAICDDSLLSSYSNDLGARELQAFAQDGS